MTILALDLATSTGFAMSNGISGSVSWKEYSHDYGEVDLAFRRWLSDLIAEHGVTLVVIEPPVLRGAASILLVGLYWSANGIAALHEAKRKDAHSNTVRRWLFGADRLKELKKAVNKGQARKQLKAAVIEAMRERGHSPANDDEADALAMLHWVQESAQ